MLTSAVVAVLACLAWPGATRGTADGTAPPGAGPGPGLRAVLQSVLGLVGRARARAGTRNRLVDPWVADFAEVVAIGLEAGLDLPAAALASARSPGVLAQAPWLAGRLADSVDGGRGVTTLLESDRVAGQEVGRDLGLLVAAWRLAEEVGAGAATVTASAAASVRARRSAAERMAVVVAGPRASMALLSALPLAGPAAAMLVGMSPGRLYDSPASWVLAVTGLLLTALGWWWARWLLRRAVRPGRTDGPPK